MTPFIKNDSIFNDDAFSKKEERKQAGDFDVSDIDINKISTDKFNLDPPEEAVFDDSNLKKKASFFFSKNMLIFSMVWIIIFLFLCILFLFNRNNNSSDSIEELPVIRAEAGPVKEMVQSAKIKDSRRVYSCITDENDDDQIEKAVNSAEVEYDDIKNEISEYREDDKIDDEKSDQDMKSDPLVSKYSDIDEYSNGVLNNRVEQGENLRLSKKRKIKDNLNSLNDLGVLEEGRESEVNVKKKKSLKGFFRKKGKDVRDMNIFIPYSAFDSEEVAFREYENLVKEHEFIKGFGYKIVKNGAHARNRYRLVFGPFDSIDSADSAVDKMRAVGVRVIW